MHILNRNFLKDLADKISEALPAQTQLSACGKDFKKNCQATLKQAFAKLDLVTREEFDTQTKVLKRTREKLEALEKQLHDLEQQSEKKHRS